MLDWKYNKRGQPIVKKAFKPEQIMDKLCEAVVLLSQGATASEVSRKLGVTT